MRYAILHLLSCFAFVITSCAFAQGAIRPLSGGDTIVVGYLTAEQKGAEPVSFLLVKSEAFKVLAEDNGNLGLARSGTWHPTLVRNKNLTTIVDNGKSIPEDWQFIRMPVGQPLRPGMRWKVPPAKFWTSCTNKEATVEYEAVSSEGPEVHILIDGVDTIVPTIKIEYAGSADGCVGTLARNLRWKMSEMTLYSPQLNNFIRQEVIHWNIQGNGRTFLQNGRGWKITSIQTGAPKIQTVIAK